MEDKRERPVPKPDIDDLIFGGEEKGHSER